MSASPTKASFALPVTQLASSRSWPGSRATWRRLAARRAPVTTCSTPFRRNRAERRGGISLPSQRRPREALGTRGKARRSVGALRPHRDGSQYESTKRVGTAPSTLPDRLRKARRVQEIPPALTNAIPSRGGSGPCHGDRLFLVASAHDHENVLLEARWTAHLTFNRPTPSNSINDGLARTMAATTAISLDDWVCGAPLRQRPPLLRGGDVKAFEALGDGLPQHPCAHSGAAHGNRAGSRRRPGGRRARQRGGRGSDSSACRPCGGRGVDQVRHGVYGHRTHARRVVSGSCPPRGRPCARAHAHQRVLSAEEALDWGLITSVVPTPCHARPTPLLLRPPPPTPQKGSRRSSRSYRRTTTATRGERPRRTYRAGQSAVARAARCAGGAP